VEIRVLGPFEVASDDGSVLPLAAKQQRLLAALAADRGKCRTVDFLIDAVWAGQPPRNAAKALQLYVSRLRKALRTEIRIRTDTSGYTLEPDEDSLDATRFERLLSEARSASGEGNALLAVSLLQRALSMWRGDAFGELACEEFARAEASRLEELRLLAVDAWLEAQLRLGRHAAALGELRECALAHPLRERSQGQLMLALYRCGRQTEALEVFTAFRRRLRNELGLEPGPELHNLQRRILSHDPTLTAPDRARQSLLTLRAPMTELLGRERELSELRALLASRQARLLVLTGAGGSGKTRLAIEVARRNASSFANGAALIELAPLRDPDLVPAAIATALGVREYSDDPLTMLTVALRSREILLVLDNAEHLRAAAPLYTELLGRLPRLTLLVTSRSVLHLSGEYVYPVEPLAAASAKALFRERGREADPRFEPDADAEDTIDRICDRLDRLPLAIEIAASRIRTLTAAELLERLDRRLPLLAGGARDLPARQQTLQATLEWSYDLLDEHERRDFARLAVFAGGCTLEAAEAVCETSLDRLSALVDQHLLRHIVTGNGSRYDMLETIREYALERLDETAPGAYDLRREHAEYYAQQFEQLASKPQAPSLMQIFVDEVDNVRQALAATTTRQTASIAVRLAAATARYWIARGAFDEGARLVREALAVADDIPPLLRAHALEVSAELEWRRNAVDDAILLAQRSRRLARRIGASSVEVRALIAEASALSQAGKHDVAESRLEEALTISHAAGVDGLIPRALAALGSIELIRHNFRRAVELFEEVLRLLGERNEWARAVNAEKLALGYLNLGQLEEATARLEESARLNAALEAEVGLASNLLSGSALAVESRDFELAAQLGGAAEAAFEKLAAPLGPFERAMKERTRVRLTAELGEARLVDLWVEGRANALGESALQRMRFSSLAELGGISREGAA
jgi:predicted ATPase/DNA-binding SARP family transcriptional activator